MAQKGSPARERLDHALVIRGLAKNREQAGRLILAGAVRVNGVLTDKQAKLIAADATIDVASRADPFVSRSGAKLQAALDTFAVGARGAVALDVGASTGGFTDCLLQRGARRVYAVDVGYGQLAWGLRRDPRVVVLERRNFRYLERAVIPDSIDLAVVDVSFISLTVILPCVIPFLAPEAIVIALVKPQFEVGRGKVGRGGIVRQDQLRHGATQKILACAESLGLVQLGVMDSPVLGQKGNKEVLAGWRRTADQTGQQDIPARRKGM